MMSTPPLSDLSLPEVHESQLAEKGYRELSAILATRLESRQFALVNAENPAHSVELPVSALKMLVEILGELANGNAVQVVPVHAELTTQEAANLLKVSRPHLVKLLEQGRIPFHKTGRHRRIRFADLMAFKQQRDAESASAMDELARLSQDLAIY